MKKISKQLILALGLSLYLTGCKEQESAIETKEVMNLDEIRQEAEIFSEEFQFENLDFSGAVFDIPEVDSVKQANFPIRKSVDELEARLIENVKKFTGLENIDRNNIQYNLREWGDGEYLPDVDIWVPCDKLTDEEKEKAWYISYNDGKYTALLYMSNYMLEMSDSGLIAEITGTELDEVNENYGRRPVSCPSVRVETYQLPEDDITGVSYTLRNGEMLLTDALSYIEKNINEYYFLGSDVLGFEVYEISVYRLQDDTHYYEFLVKSIYDGLPLNADYCMAGVLDEDRELTYKPTAGQHQLAMFCTDRISYFWSFAHSYDTVEVTKEYTELLSLWKAAQILSEAVSDNKVFEITSVQLLYETGFVSVEGDTDGRRATTIAYPVYRFSVKNPYISGYTKLHFDVDAVTGEILYWYK